MSAINLQHAKVAVIGAGTMGIGIAQLAAMHGHETWVFDVDATRTQQALTQLKAQLDKRVALGKMTEAVVNQVFEHLNVAHSLEELASSNLIIEAIVENKEVKQTVFQQLAEICSDDTIFASNTSSISITAIAAKITHPERVVGLHFFNPAPVMKLVEIICGLKTSPVIAEALFDLMHTWKKIPVTAKSTPGFIVNRVARPYYSEGFRALQEHATTPEQLDFIMRECGRFAMGPCELTDLIGQDVNFSVTQSVYQEFFDEARFRPSLVQKELVDAGCFGRKTQQGFYDYRGEKPTPQYQLPVCYAKQIQPLFVTVKGQWAHSATLIERLKHHSAFVLSFENSLENEILIAGVRLRLSCGESVDLDYAQDKVVLMDWHGDWDRAQAIVLVASAGCTAQDQQAIEAFFIALNVIPVWTQDHPGLYVIRSISMLINEASEAVLHQIASEKDIDLAMKYGVNYPKGPFEWANQIGYNIILEVLENLYRIYGEDRYRPSLYLRKKAVQGTALQQNNDQLMAAAV